MWTRHNRERNQNIEWVSSQQRVRSWQLFLWDRDRRKTAASFWGFFDYCGDESFRRVVPSSGRKSTNETAMSFSGGVKWQQEMLPIGHTSVRTEIRSRVNIDNLWKHVFTRLFKTPFTFCLSYILSLPFFHHHPLFYITLSFSHRHTHIHTLLLSTARYTYVLTFTQYIAARTCAFNETSNLNSRMNAKH